MNQAKPKCVICDREIHAPYGIVQGVGPDGEAWFHSDCGNEQAARKAIGLNTIKDSLLDILLEASRIGQGVINTEPDDLREDINSLCVLVERLAMNVGNLMGTMR